MIIGCFEVTEISPERWRVFNTLTTFEHVTYGSVDEIRQELCKQSVAWEKRFEDLAAKRPGKRAQDRWSANRTLAPLKQNPLVPKP